MSHTAGLLSKLEDPGVGHGSAFSTGNGTTPPINPLVSGPGNGGPSSTLHSNGDTTKSYSLNGTNQPQVKPAYMSYNDGVNNTLPSPSTLDLNGVNPLGPLSTVTPLNNSFVNGTYRNSAPSEGLGNF
jgi:hypothetical protein